MDRMIRRLTLVWLLWSAVGFVALIGWVIYHALTFKQDRWMLALVPFYALLSWCFYKGFQAVRRKQNSD